MLYGIQSTGKREGVVFQAVIVDVKAIVTAIVTVTVEAIVKVTSMKVN
jgi:hypothetical protein